MSQINFTQVVEELKIYGLINTREANALIKQEKEFQKFQSKQKVEDEETDYSLAYVKLGILSDAKRFSTIGWSNAFSFTPASREARKETDEIIFDEIKDFINKLSSSKLITKESTEILHEKNDKHLFVWPIQVTQEAYQFANEEYFLKPEHFYKFLTGLLNTDIIDEASFFELKDLSAKNALHQYKQIFPHLKRHVIIDLKSLSNDEEEFLKSLYEKTSAVMPGLKFTDLAFKKVVNKKQSTNDFESQNLLASFYIDKKKYLFSSFYYYESTGSKSGNNNITTEKEDRLKIPERFYQIFNKVLADNGSPYKIHSFSVGKGSIGIIALTEEQVKEISWTYDGALESYLSVGYENFDVKMTSDKIKEALNVYDSIGLFSSLSASQKNLIEERILSEEINYYADILQAFDNVIVNIDAEYGIHDALYKEITERLVNITNGIFNPTNIEDGYTFKTKKFNYGFVLNEKTYRKQLYQKEDWIDFGFWELIKKAVNEQQLTGKFYELQPTDGLTVIFLTNEQYKVLKERGMLEFSE